MRDYVGRVLVHTLRAQPPENDEEKQHVEVVWRKKPDVHHGDRMQAVESRRGPTPFQPVSNKTPQHRNDIQKLTCLYGGEGGEKSNGVHDAFSSFETPGSEYPSRYWMDNEHVKKETRQPGQVIAGRFLVAHGDGSFIFRAKFFLNEESVMKLNSSRSWLEC
jgi:hypothetical protein